MTVLPETNTAKTIRLFLCNSTSLGWEWLGETLVIENAVRRSDPPARQQGKLDCGIYVILYAWTLALGLDLSGFQGIEKKEQNNFVQTAVDIISLALQGHCSSAIIEAFLKCFKLVDLNAQIPINRQFDTTLGFHTPENLKNRVAFVNLQVKLDQHDPSLPPLEFIIQTIDTMDPEWAEYLWEKSVGELLENFELAQAVESSNGDANKRKSPDMSLGSSISLGSSVPSRRSIEDDGEISKKRKTGTNSRGRRE